MRTNMYVIIKRWKCFPLARAFDAWRHFTQLQLRKRYTNVLAVQHLAKEYQCLQL